MQFKKIIEDLGFKCITENTNPYYNNPNKKWQLNNIIVYRHRYNKITHLTIYINNNKYNDYIITGENKDINIKSFIKDINSLL